MEYNIFEPVARTSEEGGSFEDSSTKFFRFLENTTYENTLPGRCDECDECEGSPSKDSKIRSVHIHRAANEYAFCVIGTHLHRKYAFMISLKIRA